MQSISWETLGWKKHKLEARFPGEISVQFSSVAQLCPTLCTPWIAACQASLSITNSRSSLRLTSIESVMPSSHLILCRPLLFLPPIPMEKKCKKAKWLSEEALQIAVKRREVKSKGEKDRFKHLNAEFQRIARRDKKACLSDQCKKERKTTEWEKYKSPQICRWYHPYGRKWRRTKKPPDESESGEWKS